MHRRAFLAVPVAGAFATTVASAADPVTLELGNLAGDTSALVYFAQDEGYFKAAGLDVRISVFRNGQEAMTAVSAGALQIGNGNVGSIAVARERGLLAKFVAAGAVYDPSAPTALVVAGKDSPIRSAPDCNGKTVAVNGLQDQAHLQTELWLEKNGADLKSVKFVEIPFPEMAVALERNRVDAALMIEPFLTAAAGRIQVLGNAMGAIAPRWMSTGWFASDAWINANRDAAGRFAQAMARAALWANAHRAETAPILIRVTRLDPAIAGKMTRAVFATRLEPVLLQPVIDMFAHFGLLRRPLPAAEVIWTS